MTNKIKSLLTFDLDGTLVPRNRLDIHPKGLTELLNYLNSLGHVVIPVTGKPAAYVSKIFPLNSLENNGVIAENAGVYQKSKSNNIEIYGPSINEVRKLRDLLGIGMDKVNVTKIKIFDKYYEVSIDPDDVSILTVFTDPAFVAHRWKFSHQIKADELVQKLKVIIHENNWINNLEVLSPFPDGGVQVIRKDPTTGISIDKSSIIESLSSIFTDIKKIPIAMFGDGHNDIPAMRPSEITAITFSNAHDEVIEFVKNKGGYVSKYDAPEGLGVVDGILWLNKNDFFGPDQKLIDQKILSLFVLE